MFISIRSIQVCAKHTFGHPILCIVSDSIFDITVYNSDSNSVYGNRYGSLPISSFSGDINLNIAILKYSHYSTTVPNTYYTVSSTHSYNKEFKCYDNSKASQVYTNGITIIDLESAETSEDTPISYGPQYGSFSTTGTTYSVPGNTTIVFTKPSKVKGAARVGTQTLGILGDTIIRAIEFRETGTLTLTSETSTNAYYVVYNYSTSYCTFTAVISGSKKFKVENYPYLTYCVFSAFHTGKSDIEVDEITHTSYDSYKNRLYKSSSDHKTISEPCLTTFYSIAHGKISFDNDGSSNDDDYVIDGYNSKYDFYYITSSSATKINFDSSFGSVSGDFPAFAIAIIVIIVLGLVIGIITCIVCCVCCGKSFCCSSRNKVSANKHSDDHNKDHNNERETAHSTTRNSTTVVVQTHNVIASPSPQQQPQPQYYQPPPSYVPPPPQTPSYAPQHNSPYGSSSSTNPYLWHSS